MRTLLIDNYDSYTYNLFQLLAKVNGVEPLVVTNDAPHARDLDLDEFDNIVISPGPGHPARARDFGIAAELVARAPLPVLGVCLGHQGIAVHAGAQVVPSPRARHGHLTRVAHDGKGLFRGLPQGFTAVRYHSLCAAEPLPAELEATAWAEDGVNMGLRHRDLPLWGVQFHPESVATEFGTELLANFRDITRQHRERRPSRRAALITPTTPATPVPHNAATVVTMAVVRNAAIAAQSSAGAADGDVRVGTASRTAATTTKAYRLHVRAVPGAVDTEAVFGQLFAGQRAAFWLDSARVEAGLARFSFLGDGTGPLAELVTYRVGTGCVQVRTGTDPVRIRPGTIFDYLKAELGRRVIEGPELPFDFTGGYVGYFGYELKADCGSPNRHRSPTADSVWLFPDRMVAVDHDQGMTYLLALSDHSADGAAATAWLADTARLLSALPTAAANDGARGPSGAVDGASIERWLVRDRDRYLADIEASKRALLAGESYEICLTNSVRVPAAGPGYRFYRELRRCNPAPYAAYLRWDGVEVACSSPERFLKIDRHGVVETKPIKGTAPRGRGPHEDERLRAALTTSAKTRAENLMVVDLLRNDLGRVCEVGSVHVPRLMVTETYTTVHQLVSTIRGRLKAGVDAIDCVRACFPGGSMTGAPKLRTMEIIDSLETTARGIYSGAIGFLACNGTADLNIVIRTAVLVDGEWHVGAGGAIVLDSDPVEEYDEMLLKALSALRAHPALRAADAGDAAAELAEVGF